MAGKVKNNKNLFGTSYEYNKVVRATKLPQKRVYQELVDDKEYLARQIEDNYFFKAIVSGNANKTIKIDPSVYSIAELKAIFLALQEAVHINVFNRKFRKLGNIKFRHGRRDDLKKHILSIFSPAPYSRRADLSDQQNAEEQAKHNTTIASDKMHAIREIRKIKRLTNSLKKLDLAVYKFAEPTADNYMQLFADDKENEKFQEYLDNLIDKDNLHNWNKSSLDHFATVFGKMSVVHKDSERLRATSPSSPQIVRNTQILRNYRDFLMSVTPVMARDFDTMFTKDKLDIQTAEFVHSRQKAFGNDKLFKDKEIESALNYIGFGITFDPVSKLWKLGDKPQLPTVKYKVGQADHSFQVSQESIDNFLNNFMNKDHKERDNSLSAQDVFTSFIATARKEFAKQKGVTPADKSAFDSALVEKRKVLDVNSNGWKIAELDKNKEQILNDAYRYVLAKTYKAQVPTAYKPVDNIEEIKESIGKFTEDKDDFELAIDGLSDFATTASDRISEIKLIADDEEIIAKYNAIKAEASGDNEQAKNVAQTFEYYCQMLSAQISEASDKITQPQQKYNAIIETLNREATFMADCPIENLLNVKVTPEFLNIYDGENPAFDDSKALMEFDYLERSQVFVKSDYFQDIIDEVKASKTLDTPEKLYQEVLDYLYNTGETRVFFVSQDGEQLNETLFGSRKTIEIALAKQMGIDDIVHGKVSTLEQDIRENKAKALEKLAYVDKYFEINSDWLNLGTTELKMTKDALAAYNNSTTSPKTIPVVGKQETVEFEPSQDADAVTKRHIRPYMHMLLNTDYEQGTICEIYHDLLKERRQNERDGTKELLKKGLPITNYAYQNFNKNAEKENEKSDIETISYKFGDKHPTEETNESLVKKLKPYNVKHMLKMLDAVLKAIRKVVIVQEVKQAAPKENPNDQVENAQESDVDEIEDEDAKLQLAYNLYYHGLRNATQKAWNDGDDKEKELIKKSTSNTLSVLGFLATDDDKEKDEHKYEVEIADANNTQTKTLKCNLKGFIWQYLLSQLDKDSNLEAFEKHPELGIDATRPPESEMFWSAMKMVDEMGKNFDDEPNLFLMLTSASTSIKVTKGENGEKRINLNSLISPQLIARYKQDPTQENTKVLLEESGLLEKTQWIYQNIQQSLKEYYIMKKEFADKQKNPLSTGSSNIPTAESEQGSMGE